MWTDEQFMHEIDRDFCVAVADLLHAAAPVPYEEQVEFAHEADSISDPLPLGDVILTLERLGKQGDGQRLGEPRG